MQADQIDNLRNQLLTSVGKLQISCNIELQKQVEHSNVEHTNTASLYFWWLEASSIDGFLEAEYAKISTRKLRPVTYGVNHRYLILMFYGRMLGDTAIDRKSRVLNELNKEFKKNPKLYEGKDRVQNLAQFIVNSGGMVKLYERTYTNFVDQTEALELDEEDDIETDIEVGDDRKKKYMEVVKVEISNDLRIKCLIDDAKNYFASSSKLHKVDITPDLDSNENEFVVIAAKKVNGCYEILELTKNDKQLDAALVSAYRQQYGALPNSTRCIIETIKTQCLALKAAKHMEKALIEPSTYHAPKAKYRRTPAKRRLIYSEQLNALILSPIDFTNGNGDVVGGAITIAKPKSPIFKNAASDLYMPLMDRRIVEQRLIATNDFNLFKASNSDVIGTHGKFDGDLSHLIRLDSKLNNGDFIFLNFFGFGDDTAKLLPQLIYDDANNAVTTQLTLSIEQVRKITNALAKTWMYDIGENISRPEHRFWDFSITQNAVQIDFDEHEGVFLRADAIAFDTPLSVNVSFHGTFFTQELVPALLALGELDITGNVMLGLSDKGLVLQYQTEAAEYQVCIPNWDYFADNRSYAGFATLYTPASSLVDTENFEFDEYEVNEDFYKGLDLLNVANKAEAQTQYKHKIISEQSELADGCPELSKYVNWLTFDTEE